VPQEAVLIEGETVWVEAVDKVMKTLTVRRGYVRPASSHAAGTRLAAHITLWPQNLDAEPKHNVPQSCGQRCGGSRDMGQL